MATLTLRTSKGSPLTFQEIDDNFSNLDSDVGNIDISGTVDSAYIDNLIPGLDAGSGGDDF
jgi:hypothetical protein